MILQCFEANKTMTMSFTLIQHVWSCMPSDQWVQFAAHLPPSDEKDCNSLESGMIMQKEFCGTVSSCTQETCNFFKLAVLFLMCKKMSLGGASRFLICPIRNFPSYGMLPFVNQYYFQGYELY